MIKQRRFKKRFVVCVKNEGYQASLELRKIYQVLPDDKASEHNYIRIIDESGEDYLFPADNFIPIELPEVVEKALGVAT